MKQQTFSIWHRVQLVSVLRNPEGIKLDQIRDRLDIIEIIGVTPEERKEIKFEELPDDRFRWDPDASIDATFVFEDAQWNMMRDVALTATGWPVTEDADELFKLLKSPEDYKAPQPSEDH